jgi:catechol 2,3-dioxygenase-like lactoylglutathione lyase family enzyme
MARMRAVTPFLRVPDIDKAVAFFTETLGFTCPGSEHGYAYVWRDGAAFRMIHDEPFPPRGEGRYLSYVDVEDVDALWAELKPKLDLLPPEDVCGPPFDQDYGQREFWVKGPDGEIIAFGQGIPDRT